jgi:uncharacterized protein (DUF1501 family)
MADAQTYLTGNGDQKQSLIVVFLRGGADGLALVGPLQDDDYYRARPRLALGKQQALKLDGFFGLNPLLRELHPVYESGEMAIIHCAGSEDSTRSHFEAQDLMEHGGLVAGGWLGRFLRSKSRSRSTSKNESVSGALTAVAVGKELPECLRGAPAAAVMQSVEDFSLGKDTAPLAKQFDRLYALEHDALGNAARDTLKALDRMSDLRASSYQPEHGANYGSDSFSQGLKQVARLMKARVGLEAASIDLGGWDSHFAQGTLIDPLMPRLAKGLAAFHRDLGQLMASTTIVVMTEFGRRVRENASFGTDHGRGGVMFVMGGGVKGGRVIGPWPGLKGEALEGPGDLPVMNNYRDVLAPILARQGAASNLAEIFPEYSLKPLDLYG